MPAMSSLSPQAAMAGTAEAKKYGSSVALKSLANIARKSTRSFKTTWTRVQKRMNHEITNNQISHIEIVAVAAKPTLLNSNSQRNLVTKYLPAHELSMYSTTPAWNTARHLKVRA